MIIIISPAKTINFSLPFASEKTSRPIFRKETTELVSVMKKYSPENLSLLMNISDTLGMLNFERYQGWNKRNIPKKQALAVFKGEVYNGMEAWEWTAEEIEYAQEHLRILSGLYGVLRPLDVIKAYRLEMGTKLEMGSLYQYWGDKLTRYLNRDSIQKGKILVNLASYEYNKAAQLKAFKGTVITPDFKDRHNGAYKIIGVYAKKARGLMARFILQNKLENPEEIKAFCVDGYVYNPNLSMGNNFVFTRG